MKKTAVYALALVAVGLALAIAPARSMAQSSQSVATDTVQQRVELSVKASSKLDAVKFALSLENFQLDEQLEIRDSWSGWYNIAGKVTGPISDLSGRLLMRNFIIGKTENGKTITVPEHSLLTVELPPSLPKLHWKLEEILGSICNFRVPQAVLFTPFGSGMLARLQSTSFKHGRIMPWC